MKLKINKLTLYTIILVLGFFSVNILLGFVLTKQADYAIRVQIEHRMLDVANSAASVLDGDKLRVLSAEDIDSEAYQYTLNVLSRFQNNIELEYIYCIRDMGNDHFVFTIDPSEDPGEFGEDIQYTIALHEASLGTASVDKVPYGDRWGRFYSAYSPVYDSDNNVGGIVAVDFSADWYEDQIARFIKTTTMITTISTLITFVIIIFIVSNYRKRFNFIMNELNVVSDGIETLVKETSRSNIKESGIEIKQEKSGDDITELTNRILNLEDKLSDEISFVRSQAYIDTMSGLGNRTAYEEHISLIDEKIRTERPSFRVLVFDLNGLKNINDTLGHEKGDQAIIAVSAVLKEVFADSNIYRIGGDEFVVIMEDSRQNTDILIDQVAEALNENASLSISKGSATYIPDTDMRFRDVFARADQVMYDDKREYYRTHSDRRRKHV